MNRLTLAAVLVLAACLSAGAQDFRVQYLEGLVELQREAAWREVAVGDTVAAAAVLRLDDGAVIELAGSGGMLRIARRGTYDLARLATASAQSRSAGVGTFLTQRARAMAVPAERKAGASVAGVRAEMAAPSRAQPQWVGGETTDELIAAGTKKLAEGAYKDAYALFEEARDAASLAGGPDQARALFYLGYAAYLDGDVVSALRLLDKPRPDPAAGTYSDHVLVLSQLLVETFAYADAADLLRGYIGSGSASGDNLQTARLFLGLSQRGLGNREQAAESLREAQRLNASSEAGRAATRLLESL